MTRPVSHQAVYEALLNPQLPTDIAGFKSGGDDEIEFARVIIHKIPPFTDENMKDRRRRFR